MEKIFTVGLNSNRALIDIGYEIIELPIFNGNESEYHDFVINNFKILDFDKLIIDLSSNPIVGFKIAYHIRLSLTELKEKCLVPILFVTHESVLQVMSSNPIWSHILSSEGAMFSPYSLAKIEIENLEPLKSGNYQTQFLDVIQVQPDEKIGKHSIANLWGAFSMDEASNLNVLKTDKEAQKVFHKLYFKYIYAFQFDFEGLKNNGLNKSNKVISLSKVKINSIGKKILLIDDEADKGWELVLKSVFETSHQNDFQVIKEPVKDFDSFTMESKILIDSNDFDLYLVDLRLNGIEQGNKSIEEFSGTSVLKHIKKNKGKQVMVFTASNKAWNIQTLLELGADSYYIKESPEYKFSKEISESNYQIFLENTERLLQRNYLRGLFSRIEIIKAKLQSFKSSNKYDSNFLNELELLLDQAFEMHYSAISEKQFAYAYVTLYMIIERINTEFVIEGVDHFWFVGTMQFYNWVINNNSRLPAEQPAHFSSRKKPFQWCSMANIIFRKFGIHDIPFINKTRLLINLRNDFIHSNAGIDPKIYNSIGFTELFETVERILNYF